MHMLVNLYLYSYKYCNIYDDSYECFYYIIAINTTYVIAVKISLKIYIDIFYV